MSQLAKDAAAWIKATKKEGVKTNLQREIETQLGRTLEDYEAVYFVNGKLCLGFKPGVPYQYLQCRICKNRQFTVSAPGMSD